MMRSLYNGMKSAAETAALAAVAAKFGKGKALLAGLWLERLEANSVAGLFYHRIMEAKINEEGLSEEQANIEASAIAAEIYRQCFVTGVVSRSLLGAIEKYIPGGPVRVVAKGVVEGGKQTAVELLTRKSTGDAWSGKEALIAGGRGAANGITNDYAGPMIDELLKQTFGSGRKDVLELFPKKNEN